MVGIDAEWKPMFCTSKNVLALLQIASKDQIFILDACALSLQCQELWHELGVTLFTNENIIKLGNVLIQFVHFTLFLKLKTAIPAKFH